MSSKYQLSESQKLFLDALRGAASLLVVFGHASSIFIPESPIVKVHVGDFAVLIFFILSGFLISFSLFSKLSDPMYSFRFFFADRFSRIFVPFVPVIIAVAVCDYFIIDALRGLDIYGQVKWIDNIEPRHGWVHFVGNLLMLQDFPLFQIFRVAGFSDEYFVRPYGSAAPFWTVSIEWWLYVCFGMGVWMLYQPSFWRSWKIKIFCGGAFLVSVVSVFYHFVAGSAQCLSMVWGLGAAFGWLLSKNMIPKSLNKKICVSIFFYSVVCMVVRVVAMKIDHIEKLMELQFATFLMVAVFSLFLFFEGQQVSSRLFEVPIKWLANYSYSMYLTHNTVLVLVHVFLFSGKVSGWLGMFVSIVLSNLVAVVFWWGFERHYVKFSAYLKER